MRKINLPRTIWWENNSVKMINQNKLPLELEILEVRDYLTLGNCIKEMNVRGAPAIGAAAAFGMALASLEFKGNDTEKFLEFMNEVSTFLKNTRPTAVNLSWAVQRIMKNVTREDVERMRNEIINEAKKIAEEDVITNKKIGEHGSKLIEDNFVVGTHCNAGSLATVYYGTALAPIYYSWEQGKDLHVVVDETRPRLQGASLTAWELSHVGILYTLITDNMAAYFMKKKKINLVIVGADRIAVNGDVANKIGTYSLAIVAKKHGVPFYVAAPTSTIDQNSKTGDDIPIEERAPEEILFVRGQRIAPKDTVVWNPAFDVTQAELITGIITEKGIFEPKDVRNSLS